LDSYIGDGDHGFGMSNGFRIGLTKVMQLPRPSIEECLRTIGTSLITEVGGASGTIFGSWFTGMAKVAKGHDCVGVTELAEMAGSGLELVKRRGHAEPGDKTMVDALQPAVESLMQSATHGISVTDAMAKAAGAARTGAVQTKQFIGKHGRAKYFGEKSIGFQDAGATTVSVILQAFAEALGATPQ